jgi:DNA-3-methyladenine glycosylase
VKVLDSTFFDRPADQVAHDLIGHRLNWRRGNKPESRIIIETEAYIGPNDLASHAAKGRTKRNAAMFGPPGTFYIYFVYGMHWMLNVVTGPVGYPAAVLIRSVESIIGPARLTIRPAQEPLKRGPGALMKKILIRIELSLKGVVRSPPHPFRFRRQIPLIRIVRADQSSFDPGFPAMRSSSEKTASSTARKNVTCDGGVSDIAVPPIFDSTLASVASFRPDLRIP